ncbi:MAG: rhomboid family intramembrane serine protease [Chthoniobacterales bacterium]
MTFEQPRDEGGRFIAPVTLVLIAINCGIYFLQRTYLLENTTSFLNTFALSERGLSNGAFWQIITYGFIHGGLAHLFMNMAGLFFIGREMELILKPARYLLLYFSGGVLGGLLQVVLSPPNLQLIGASASVFAVMIAFTTLYPNVRITALIFFVIPLIMKAKVLGWGLVIVSVIFLFSGLEGEVGHLAHLGGCVVGFIFGLWWRPQIASLVPEVSIFKNE